MRRLAFAGLFVLVSWPVFAKTDAPNVRQLAIDHPWHPREASSTLIELSCGKERTKYELRVDDRGWRYLLGPKVSAIATPFGRFVKSGPAWTPAEMNDWYLPRERGLSFRELAGEPLFGDEWIEQSSSREKDGTIVAAVLDSAQKARAMRFDPIVKVWMELDGLRVLETQRFGDRMLPKKVAVSAECEMTRTIRAGKFAMPSREELVRE